MIKPESIHRLVGAPQCQLRSGACVVVDTLGYHIVLQPFGAKQGGGYLATVPDLPGCMSDGRTAEEALDNIGEVIAMWRHCAAQAGRKLPHPTCASIDA